MDVYRSSGAGGQHVNKTESAVRITHVPDGHRRRLPERAHPAQEPRHRDEDAARPSSTSWRCNKRNAAAQVLEDTKADVSWGNQIRSYVLDQSRIKDLRTDVEIGQHATVLDGDLDPFMEASSEGGTVSDDDDDSDEPPQDENKLIAERRAKLAARCGEPRASAFPNDFRRDALAGELLAAITAQATPSGSSADRRSCTWPAA